MSADHPPQAGPGSGVINLRRDELHESLISFRAPSQSIRAEKRRRRAARNRFVRPFPRPCGDDSIRAGCWPFRARQLSFRAGENRFVRPFFNPCGQKPRFSVVFAVFGGQKATAKAVLVA